MFTGIVAEIGHIKEIQQKAGKRYITISTTDIHTDLVNGESVACNGICLTVCEVVNHSIRVEISHQTAQITTATHWCINTPIHLEKALALNQRLNGHLVQGHIDITTTLINSTIMHSTHYLHFHLPAAHAHLVVEHGSICLDGVSLTVAELSRDTFGVALIDFTLKNTHFAHLKAGSLVNIEFDIIGKYVNRLLETKSTTQLSEKWLVENGF